MAPASIVIVDTPSRRTPFRTAGLQSDPPTPPRVRVPAFAGSVVVLIGAAVAVTHLAVAAAGGLWFDEAYMLAIARHHLTWGSADQPPVTMAAAALMDAVAPGSVLALRLPAILGTTGAVVLAALVARELGGDRRAQAMTAGVQATLPWSAVAGHWLTPYTLEPVQWLALLWLVVRWLRTRDDRLLLVVGVVAGIGAQTKFQVLLLCAVLLATALVCGPRQLLRRSPLWVGIGIGGAIALPTLLWQALHDWPQLRMAAVVAAESVAYGARPGTAVITVLMAGVAGIWLAPYGVWRLLAGDAQAAEHRFIAVTAVVLYAFFVATAGRPYYLGGLYGLLAAAGAVGLQRRREAGHVRRRWVLWPAFALSVAVAGGFVAVGHVAAVESATIGAGIASRTAAAYHALPAAQRERTAVLGQSYITAAYLDVHGPRDGLPPVFSTSRGYGYFPPPSEDRDAVLYAGDPAELRPYFAELHQIAAGGPDPREQGVWLGTGRSTPWDVIWVRRRHLDVAGSDTPLGG